MQSASGGGAGAGNIAAILGDFRLHQNDIEHDGASFRRNAKLLYVKPVGKSTKKFENLQLFFNKCIGKHSKPPILCKVRPDSQFAPNPWPARQLPCTKFSFIVLLVSHCRGGLKTRPSQNPVDFVSLRGPSGAVAISRYHLLKCCAVIKVVPGDCHVA